MKINKNILEKVEVSLQQQKEEQDYLFKCRKACICPICGSEMKTRGGIGAHGDDMLVCTACNWSM